jgi:hypothetical protein
MQPLFPSAMRTLVPIVAGALLTLALRTGVDLDSGTATTVVTAALTAVYYLLFRGFEHLADRLGAGRLRTAAGVLLGWARPPQYPAPSAHAAPTAGGAPHPDL